jgi:capsular polysaccharide biosynthesis protein
MEKFQMEETREIIEKNGVTFKDLFIVFKRLWLLLLAVIMICSAGLTLLSEKKTAQTHVAYATLVVDASSADLRSSLADTYIFLLSENIFNSDVSSRTLKDSEYRPPNDSGYFKYVSDEERPFVVHDGYVSAYAQDGIPFITISYTSVHSQYVAQITLKQIILSLQNVAKMMSEDGKYVFELEKGRISQLGGSDNISSYSPPKNTQKATFIGILLGLIVDAAILLLVYKLDDTIKTKDELERITGVTFIAYIEDIEDERGGKR